MDIIYDIETYPNCFTLAAEHADLPFTWSFEISEFRNDTVDLYNWCRWLNKEGARMVGFNNIGFDYPVLHAIIRSGVNNPRDIYEYAMKIIEVQNNELLTMKEKRAFIVKQSDTLIEQVDLFKIHHFDNNARRTSLKALEFAMMSDNISDLPFPVGTMLSKSQISELKRYNAHDTSETKKFYHKSKSKIEFREELSTELDYDFTNCSNAKIGAEVFRMELQKVGVQVYNYGHDGRTPRQTKRKVIHLKDAILPWIKFDTPEFHRLHQHILQQSITETKGVFKDLIAKVNGIEFKFTTGGMHAARNLHCEVATADRLIISDDVSSYYPNLAIKNRFYPEHLGEKFCDVYDHIYKIRKTFPKGSSKNKAFKEALNTAYGSSNEKHSFFYDPLFTMKITLNGQLLLCKFAENLLHIPTVKILMVNTDGIEYSVDKEHEASCNKVRADWMKMTQLELEQARYSKLFIRDCNNYVGVYV